MTGKQTFTGDPLPAEFLDRLKQIIDPQDWSRTLNSFSLPKRTTCRINTILAEPAPTFAMLGSQEISVERVDWCDYAFSVPAAHRAQLTHLPESENGRLYIQGFSSILASLVLDPQPGEWNLDLAAAPGGKSTHIVALMQNDGKLSVVEPIKKRMFRLADNLKRLGSTISRTYLMDGRKAGRKVPERFDRVMLDAPCSSESRIRANDSESARFWSPRKIREQSRKQSGLIESGFETLKPGGTMLYCTCSFAPEENEAIVHHLLERFPDQASLLPIDLPIDNARSGLTRFGDAVFSSQLELSQRILPNEYFDGFYMAKIRKDPN